MYKLPEMGATAGSIALPIHGNLGPKNAPSVPKNSPIIIAKTINTKPSWGHEPETAAAPNAAPNPIPNFIKSPGIPFNVLFSINLRTIIGISVNAANNQLIIKNIILLIKNITKRKVI